MWQWLLWERRPRHELCGIRPGDGPPTARGCFDPPVGAASPPRIINNFPEAMACGLPVVTTDVGGNAEVVCMPELGAIVPFGDSECVRQSIDAALTTEWDREKTRSYAEDTRWESRVARLQEKVQEMLKAADRGARGAESTEYQ